MPNYFNYFLFTFLQRSYSWCRLWYIRKSKKSYIVWKFLVLEDFCMWPFQKYMWNLQCVLNPNNVIINMISIKPLQYITQSWNNYARFSADFLHKNKNLAESFFLQKSSVKFFFFSFFLSVEIYQHFADVCYN